MREELEAGRWGRTRADLVPAPAPSLCRPEQSPLTSLGLGVLISKPGSGDALTVGEGGPEHSGERGSDFPASQSLLLPWVGGHPSLPLCYPSARPSPHCPHLVWHRSTQGPGQGQWCRDGVGPGDMIAQGERADRNGRSRDDGGVHLPCPPPWGALVGGCPMSWGNRSHHSHFPGFLHMLCLEPRRGWPPARPEWTCTSQKGPIGTPGERTLGAVREE